MMAQALADLWRRFTSASTRTFSGHWNLLLDNSEMLHQHSSELFYDVRSVPSILELQNDSLHNLIVDALHINQFGLGVIPGVLCPSGTPLCAW